MPIQKVHFGVGNPRGPQSAVWMVWTGAATSDVFVANRHLASSMKVSLHESGRWRLAFTEAYAALQSGEIAQGADRARQKWSRPPEIRPGWTQALNVIIPVGELWTPDPPLDLPKTVAWRPPPDSGMETQFGIFFERSTGLTGRRPEGDIVATFYLPSGEFLWVMAVDVPSATENLEVYERSRANIRNSPGGADYGTRGFVFGERPNGVRIAIDLRVGPSG